MNNITKEQFLSACSKYPEKKLYLLIVKYFTNRTKPEDKKPSLILRWFLASMIIIGSIGVIFNLNQIFVTIPTIMFVITIVIMVVIAYVAMFQHTIRKYKLKKELKLSSYRELKELGDKYLGKYE